MKKLLALVCFLSLPIYAQEVPLPGTARKGPIQVTPEGQDTSVFDLETYKVIPRAASRRVQKLIDGLRADLAACKKGSENSSCEQKVTDLQAELRAAMVEVDALKQELANVPEPLPVYKNRIKLLGGVAPDGVKVEDIEDGKKAKLNESGPAVALGYDRLITERFSLGGYVSMSTSRTNVVSGFLGAGYDF